MVFCTVSDKFSCMKISKKPISAPNVLNEAFDYAKPATFVRGTTIESGPFRLVILSGTASVDENGKSVHIGDFGAQTRRTLQNLSELLKAATIGWQDVIKTTIFLRDIDRDYEEFCQIRKEFYDKLNLPFYPASTCVGAKICRSELLVEIELWALANKDNQLSSCPAGGNPKE